jgi:hypothetical protein
VPPAAADAGGRPRDVPVLPLREGVDEAARRLELEPDPFQEDDLEAAKR